MYRRLNQGRKCLFSPRIAHTRRKIRIKGPSDKFASAKRQTRNVHNLSEDDIGGTNKVTEEMKVNKGSGKM